MRIDYTKRPRHAGRTRAGAAHRAPVSLSR